MRPQRGDHDEQGKIVNRRIKRKLERELVELEQKLVECRGKSTHGKTRRRILEKRIAEIKELLQSRR